MFEKRSEYCVNDANLNTRNDCQDSERMDPEKQSLMFDANKKCINEKKNRNVVKNKSDTPNWL